MSTAATALQGLFGRLVPYKVLAWSSSSSDRDTDRRRTTLADADVISSLYNESVGKHALVIDIDHPSWLVKSSTEGHYHLYIEVPGGIPTEEYMTLLWALAAAGVIETGYASASVERGFTCVRLPWVKKSLPATSWVRQVRAT